MKLTAEVLLEAMEGRLTVRSSTVEDGAPLLGRPLLYEEGSCPVEAGGFYLSNSPSPALCRGGVCTVYFGGARPAAAGGSSIEVTEDLGTVLNRIQEIFDRYQDWESSMERTLLNRGTVQMLLQESADLFNNPLMVIRSDFTLVAQVGEKALPPEHRIFSPELDSMELFNALRQDALYNRMEEAREPFLYPAHIMGWRSWNMNIVHEEHTTHRLILAEHNRKLRVGDGWLLSQLAPYVAYLLEREKITSRSASSLRNLFLRILSDRTADYLEMSQQLTRQDWEAEDEYFCLVLKVTYLDKKSLTTNLICDHIEKQYPYSCSFSYQEDIVTFFNVTKAEKDLEGIAGEMKYFIRESFLKAGYSRVMRGHGNLRRQYVQACVALDVGSRTKPYLWIHHFNGVAFPYLLEQATRRLPGHMICHEKLLALQRHDEQQNTEYMKTLRVYLDQHLNAMQTAKELFIHRSTFLYRMEKIKEILESRLDDPEEMLYLAVSFRLLENEQKKR